MRSAAVILLLGLAVLGCNHEDPRLATVPDYDWHITDGGIPVAVPIWLAMSHKLQPALDEVDATVCECGCGRGIPGWTQVWIEEPIAFWAPDAGCLARGCVRGSVMYVAWYCKNCETRYLPALSHELAHVLGHVAPGVP